MNIFLWVLQILLAIHTAIGAIWKFNNPAALAIPSLEAIPPFVWNGLSVVEIFISLGLVVPLFYRPLGFLAPIGAGLIAAEMVLFSGVHLSSGEPNNSPVVYWTVVAVVCIFIAYGRLALRPFSSTPSDSKA